MKKSVSWKICSMNKVDIISEKCRNDLIIWEIKKDLYKIIIFFSNNSACL